MRYFVPSSLPPEPAGPLSDGALHVHAILLPPFYLFYQDAGYGIKFLKDIPVRIYLYETPLLIPRPSATALYFEVYDRRPLNTTRLVKQVANV